MHKAREALVSDHNHRTGRRRAYICQRCNTLVGFYEHRETYPAETQLTETYLAKYDPEALRTAYPTFIDLRTASDAERRTMRAAGIIRPASATGR